jgi:hypothetical protein
MHLTVNTLYIDTSSEDVGSNQDTLLKCLELLISLDTLWLG